MRPSPISLLLAGTWPTLRRQLHPRLATAASAVGSTGVLAVRQTTSQLLWTAPSPHAGASFRSPESGGGGTAITSRLLEQVYHTLRRWSRGTAGCIWTRIALCSASSSSPRRGTDALEDAIRQAVGFFFIRGGRRKALYAELRTREKEATRLPTTHVSLWHRPFHPPRTAASGRDGRERA
jgi:hypothetical protein